MSESPGGRRGSPLSNGGSADLAPGQPPEEWRPLADRVAGNARDFLDGLTAVARGEGADQTIPLLLLEMAQMMLAGAQLGASKDVILPSNWEPDIGADPDVDLDTLRTGLAARLGGIRRLRGDLRPLTQTLRRRRSGSRMTWPPWPLT